MVSSTRATKRESPKGPATSAASRGAKGGRTPKVAKTPKAATASKTPKSSKAKGQGAKTPKTKAPPAEEAPADEPAAEEAPATAEDPAAANAVTEAELRLTPASGRWWKPQSNARSSSKACKTKAKKGNRWERRKAQERQHKEVVALSRELAEQQKRHKEEKAEKMKEKKKMKEENERRGEVVVPITNTLKLKKMSRKQLRLLGKR